MGNILTIFFNQWIILDLNLGICQETFMKNWLVVAWQACFFKDMQGRFRFHSFQHHDIVVLPKMEERKKKTKRKIHDLWFVLSK